MLDDEGDQMKTNSGKQKVRRVKVSRQSHRRAGLICDQAFTQKGGKTNENDEGTKLMKSEEELRALRSAVESLPEEAVERYERGDKDMRKVGAKNHSPQSKEQIQ